MFMFLKKMRKNKFGYTLTELIVVVSILGILAVVASPFVADYVNQAKVSADSANAKIMSDIASRYSATYGSYPTTGAIQTAIAAELNPVPGPEESTKIFIYDSSTGQVNVVDSAHTPGTNEIKITATAGGPLPTATP